MATNNQPDPFRPYRDRMLAATEHLYQAKGALHAFFTLISVQNSSLAEVDGEELWCLLKPILESVEAAHDKIYPIHQ